jgi:hypothetical protein
VWLTLAAGCLGVVMGINRAIKTREQESEALRILSGVAGLVLIGVSLYTVVASGGLSARTSYAVLYLMILGLSLCARQLEGIPVAAVFIIIVGLGVCYVIGRGGMLHDVNELLLKYNDKILIIGGVMAIAVVVVLAMTTLDRLVSMVLNFLGHWMVVIVLSAVSVVHAGLVLFTRGGRGLLKFP